MKWKYKIIMLTYIAVLELQASLGFVSLGPGVEVDHNQASGKMSQNVEIDEGIQNISLLKSVLFWLGKRAARQISFQSDWI